MCVDRRDFLRLSAAGMAGAALLTDGEVEAMPVPQSIRELRPATARIVQVSDEERRERIAKAQRLMAEHRIDAIFLESGSSLFYYTGARWGASERMFGAVIPARGELAWITPKFEEERARELIRFGKDIRAWEEDESPYKVVANIFKDRGIRAGRIGMEERVRFFLFDGIRQEARHPEYTSADPVTVGCRVIKSSAEIAQLQRANEITLAAFKAASGTVKEGMTQYEFGENV